MAYASSIDFSGGLALNGNDPSFYLAHLRRFAQDTSLLPLSDALAQGDVHQAFLLAHTLKGLSAQLAVTCVYRPAAVLCDLLRDGSADRLPQAQEAFFALVAGLEEARSVLTSVLPPCAEHAKRRIGVFFAFYERRVSFALLLFIFPLYFRI